MLGAAAVIAAAPPPADSLSRWLEAEPHRVRLDRELTEVSGLAVDGQGAIWAHDDERGVVHRIDPETGETTERRVLGPAPVRGDFEGLAFDGRRFHLVTSTGTLLSFGPGSGEAVDAYGIRRTDAEDVCEVEGLDFDPERRTLVLACKTIRERGRRGHLLLLEVDLPEEQDGLDDPPLPAAVRVEVSPDRLAAAGIEGRISPSGLTRSPRGWLVVAARERRILEIDDEGRILDAARLPSRHRQAEGIVVTSDTLLNLADEGGRGRAHLTRYVRDDDASPSHR